MSLIKWSGEKNKTVKKVLFITNYFYPETFRGNDIAFNLANEGYEVTVLTNIPNYPEGHFFKGYNLFKKRKEIFKGVKIIRVPIIPRGAGGKFKMILNYISGLFFLSLYACHYAIWHKFDIIFVQQLSPVFIGLPAILVKKIQKTPIYYWLLDLWPESLSAGGIKNPTIISYVDTITRYIYKHCDRILISSISFKKVLCSRGVHQDKIIYFPNWCEDSITSGEIKQIPKLPAGFRIMFAGNLGEAQNFDNLLQVILRLKDISSLKWIILGDGRKRECIETFIKENDLTKNVFLLGRYDISYMASFFNQADILLVSLKNEFAFNSTLPAKIQAYMASAKPILAMMNGEGQYIIKEANCGFCADADDINSMVSIIENLFKIPKNELTELGKNGYKYYETHFKKAICMQNLYKILSN